MCPMITSNADTNVMEQIISDFQADNVDLMVGIATPAGNAYTIPQQKEPIRRLYFPQCLILRRLGLVKGSGCTWSKQPQNLSDYLDTASIIRAVRQ